MGRKKSEVLEKKVAHLHRLRSRKSKNPEWKLDIDQVNFIEDAGYPCTEIEYMVMAQKLDKVRYRTPPILQELHYAYNKGLKFIIRRYTKEEVNFLKENGAQITPYRYEIHLEQYCRN